MSTVRIGVVGLGNMGSHHARYMSNVPGAKLGAICDIDSSKLEKFEAELKVPGFKSVTEMMDSGNIDALLIAVPHYDHMPMAAEAFSRGIHVLCEKPIAVSVKAAREGIAAYHTALRKFPNLKFGLIFQQRTNAMYQKLRDLISSGELGDITRITWIVTNWFRTWTYYASGGWRATWKGEGGGVLINQCPHNLDLLQYLTGLMPSRVTAVGTIGKTHPIEVEDDISAILEYPNGAMGHFITTTGEAPGTNRLEIAGDRGRIVAEDGKLTFHRTRKSVKEVNRTSPDSFAYVETWKCEIPFTPGGDVHKMMTDQFVDVILKNKANETLIAPGTEGAKGLEIGNAILMSGLTRKPVDLPVDGAAFDAFIEEMDRKFGGKKTLETKHVEANLGASFAKA